MIKQIYILDATGFVFRSYFAIRRMTNPKGQSTNALFGFIRCIQKLIKDFSPEHLVAVFDGPDNKQSRIDIYPEYKGHRAGMPEDLFPQLDLAIKYCEMAGIPVLMVPGVEADDTIGTIAKWAEGKNAHSYLCSSDKDLCQLISNQIKMLVTHKNNLIVDEEHVEEKYGVKPSQIIDYLGIVGDSSDNIPGIPGFGPKTAAKLLQQHTTLQNLIDHSDQITNPKQRAKIEEHAELALLSKQLATIDLDIEIPQEDDFYKLRTPDQEALTALYQEMNFLSLLKDTKTEVEAEEGTYHLIDTEEELKNLIETLSQAKELCIDTETTSLDQMTAQLVGIGLSSREKEAYYIPLNGKIGQEKAIELLKPLLENPSISYYGHNIKYDLHILLNHGIDIQNISFDTMLASYLVDPQKNRHSLDRLALEMFGKVKTPITDLIGKGKKQLSMRDVPIEKISKYCCEDVDYTARLKGNFEELLDKSSLRKIFDDIEIPLIHVLLRMERHGMYLQLPKLEYMSKDLNQKITKLQSEIYGMAGEEFNLNSPKQLSHILYEKLGIVPTKRRGAKGLSTRADVLESLKQDYPIVGLILEYRGYEKLRSTYVDALPHLINKKTHHVHPTFLQSVAATGRLACRDPNLQNIPIRSVEGKKIREAFTPEKEGWSYLGADYSQIELRLLAHLSQDPKLIEAFNKGEDIHAFTASTVFNVPLDQVTKKQRSHAKAVNFGILYGQQAYGLSQGLDISVKEASEFINTYFERYPDVKKYLNTCIEEARKTGVATTMEGRKRPLSEIHNKNQMIRAAAERLAVNTPLQGTQADIIKKAMILIDQELQKDPSLGSMVLQIHDELIFEVPDSKIDKLKTLVNEIMENITKLSVPLVVNIAIGKNWAEC